MNNSLYPSSENNLSFQLLHNNLEKPPLLFRILVGIQNIENIGLIIILFVMLNEVFNDFSQGVSNYTVFMFESFLAGILYISVHFVLLFTRIPYKLQVFSLIWFVVGFMIAGIIINTLASTFSLVLILVFIPIILQLIYILLDQRVKNYLQFQSTEFYNGLIATLLNRIEVIEEDLSQLKASRM